MRVEIDPLVIRRLVKEKMPSQLAKVYLAQHFPDGGITPSQAKLGRIMGMRKDAAQKLLKEAQAKMDEIALAYSTSIQYTTLQPATVIEQMTFYIPKQKGADQLLTEDFTQKKAVLSIYREQKNKQALDKD